MSCKKCFGETSYCQECSNNEEIKLLKDQVQFGVDAVNRLLEQNQRLIQYTLDIGKLIDRMKELDKHFHKME